eukprot:TRINITY_DN10450_c0_g1_i11.p1 TRINITY_DN10450_c0_g1~~TRINITY_DN10450_c0_g1_i11.p1  ORF type:complete len:160 (-),score=20.02 TRINITY_DN10450_c0_g1_i11:127-606(-)
MQSGAATELSKFATELGVKEKALQGVVNGILYFFNQCLRKNMAPSHVKDDLVLLGLDEPKAEILAEKWKEQYTALNQSMVAKTFKVNELVDLDWKFGVTAASSELNKVGSCFLQLRLVLEKGGKKESVLMELTLPQFYQFLQQMEAAKRQADLATTSTA